MMPATRLEHTCARDISRQPLTAHARLVHEAAAVAPVVWASNYEAEDRGQVEGWFLDINGGEYAIPARFCPYCGQRLLPE
jgi:hypothetical protein